MVGIMCHRIRAGTRVNGTLEDTMCLPLLDIAGTSALEDDFDAVLLSPTVMPPVKEETSEPARE